MAAPDEACNSRLEQHGTHWRAATKILTTSKKTYGWAVKGLGENRLIRARRHCHAVLFGCGIGGADNKMVGLAAAIFDQIVALAPSAAGALRIVGVGVFPVAEMFLEVVQLAPFSAGMFGRGHIEA